MQHIGRARNNNLQRGSTYLRKSVTSDLTECVRVSNLVHKNRPNIDLVIGVARQCILYNVGQKDSESGYPDDIDLVRFVALLLALSTIFIVMQLLTWLPRTLLIRSMTFNRSSNRVVYTSDNFPYENTSLLIRVS